MRVVTSFDAQTIQSRVPTFPPVTQKSAQIKWNKIIFVYYYNRDTDKTHTFVAQTHFIFIVIPFCLCVPLLCTQTHKINSLLTHCIILLSSTLATTYICVRCWKKVKMIVLTNGITGKRKKLFTYVIIHTHGESTHEIK